MKQYRKDAKKHLDDDEYEAYKAKKRRDGSICRGGKPHDFVLVLPFHVTYDPALYKFNPEEYYRIRDEVYKFEEEAERQLREMGIKQRYGRWPRTETRYYMCSVCKKQRYGE